MGRAPLTPASSCSRRAISVWSVIFGFLGFHQQDRQASDAPRSLSNRKNAQFSAKLSRVCRIILRDFRNFRKYLFMPIRLQRHPLHIERPASRQRSPDWPYVTRRGRNQDFDFSQSKCCSGHSLLSGIVAASRPTGAAPISRSGRGPRWRTSAPALSPGVGPRRSARSMAGCRRGRLAAYVTRRSERARRARFARCEPGDHDGGGSVDDPHDRQPRSASKARRGRARACILARRRVSTRRFVANAHYDVFRDELYFMVCGLHPRSATSTSRR